MKTYKVFLRKGSGLKHRSGKESNLGMVVVEAENRRAAILKARATLNTDERPHHYTAVLIDGTDNRGGKRENAGRKPPPDGKLEHRVIFRVSQQTHDALKEINQNVNMAARDLVLDAIHTSKIHATDES